MCGVEKGGDTRTSGKERGAIVGHMFSLGIWVHSSCACSSFIFVILHVSDIVVPLLPCVTHHHQHSSGKTFLHCSLRKPSHCNTSSTTPCPPIHHPHPHTIPTTMQPCSTLTQFHFHTIPPTPFLQHHSYMLPSVIISHHLHSPPLEKKKPFLYAPSHHLHCPQLVALVPLLVYS